MKHLILILAITLVGLGACKKDKPTAVKTFADYTFQEIKAQEANFNSNPITYNGPTTNFKLGSIIFFKTNLGNYGKMEILNVGPQSDYKLKANVVVYDPNGTKIVDKVLNDIPAQVAYGYDFDDPLLPEVSQSDPSKSDFVWGVTNNILVIFFVSGNQLTKGFLFKP